MGFLLRKSQQVLLSAEEILKRFRELVNTAFHKNGCDITYDQWVVMDVLAQTQGITQITIAKETLKEPASISRILKLLEEKELVEKVADKKNKRAKRIYLTPKGIEIHKQATRLFNNLAKKGFEGVYEQEINLFVRILDKLQGNFAKMNPKYNG